MPELDRTMRVHESVLGFPDCANNTDLHDGICGGRPPELLAGVHARVMLNMH